MERFGDQVRAVWGRSGGFAKTLIVIAGLFVGPFLLFSGLFLIPLGLWLWFRPGAGKISKGFGVAVGLLVLVWVPVAFGGGGDVDTAALPTTVTLEASTTTATVAPTPSSSLATTTSSSLATTTSSSLATTTSSTNTTTTAAATTTTAVLPVGDTDLVLDLLETIPVENEHPDGYDRDLFAHWSDVDGDGCDTRQEVLVRDANGTAQAGASGCPVVAGDWYSVYDAVWITQPSDLDIDHVVALKEAWDSGAWAWGAARREAFANDVSLPSALIAVSASSNRSKSAADPSNWLPSNGDDVCRYLAAWVAVKAKWSLSMDESEFGRLRNLLGGECIGTENGDRVPQWPTSPPSPTTTVASNPACDPSYPDVCIPPYPPDLDCGEISFRRFKVIGSDPHGFDRDGDGVGCES